MEEQLHHEIRYLGDRLGEVIDLLAPEGTKTRVETIRSLAKRRRQGDAQAAEVLRHQIESLTPQQIEELVRAFGIFFDLANLAEDRHRARVLFQRECASFPLPRAESIGAAVQALKSAGCSPPVLESLLQRLSIEPVFTAHPTEAKRRSLREKIRDLRQHLEIMDNDRLTPRERTALDQELRTDLALWWQTDFMRERRPTVTEELERSLFFFETLWQVVPQLYQDLQVSLSEHYPDQEFVVPNFLKFATWIGGDRDGNPNVTWRTTAKAMARLRTFVLAKHIKACRQLRRGLSQSIGRCPLSRELDSYLVESLSRWPQLEPLLDPIAPRDVYRRVLRVVQWRLEQTLSCEILAPLPLGAYANVLELQDELKMLAASLRQGPGGRMSAARLEQWSRQVAVFGFHGMRMDVRQESLWHTTVLHDVLQLSGRETDFANLSETAKQQCLTDSIGKVETLDLDRLTNESQETLQLFQLLAESVKVNGPQALGCHMISMTRAPSDLLAVLWLSEWAARQKGLPGGRLPMPIVPLFETIDDLTRSAVTMREIFQHPAYRAHVAADGEQQTVMIGYSDSTKDGGYLAAAWAQHQAQTSIVDVGREFGVRIKFFHGRGGALGRGGGPAARSILSAPPQTIDGSMRVTEQGEVLSARYDDPQIAKRHLEQVIWATLLVSQRPRFDVPPNWLAWMNALSDAALQAYRQLVTEPGFLEYFDQATPIGEIEQLPIGSRPARRGGQRSLDKLRAIPWVFSWTQNRQLLPAWFGIGAAIANFLGLHRDGLEKLRTMYRQWPFFAGVIENAALALAKADLGIGGEYLRLVKDPRVAQAIWERIQHDYHASVSGVLQITGRTGLLSDVAWLRDSIEVRNPYVDPLNLMQVALLERARRDQESEEIAAELQALIRATIQGIAAGLRTTG